MATKLVTLDDVTLFCQDDGAGPPVVFLHAFSFDHRMWDAQCAALAGRYRAVRYDLRGFGQSAGGTARYSHADDLAAVLDAYHLPNATLVGLSLGGGAAINFAVLRPERVKSLVLIAPSLGGFAWSAKHGTSQSRLRQIANEESVAAARDAWLSLPMFRSALANERSGTIIRDQVEAYHGRHWIETDRGRPLDPPAARRLAEIHAPTLVIVGDLDTQDSQNIADTLATGIPNARKVVLPGVGHMANLEDPDRVNSLLLSWLAEHDPAQDSSSLEDA